METAHKILEFFRGSQPAHHSYKLLLIGETGSGKTSFLNLICNCAAIEAAGKEIDDIGLTNVRTFHDVALENPKSKQMESKTFGAKMYNTKLSGLDVGVIDTPGFNDSRGFDQDEQNTKVIIQSLKAVEHINCVCLVINGRNSRISAQLKYVFTAITSILPKTVVNNIIVVFTNTVDETELNFDVDMLRQYFGKKIPEQNIFYVENPCCKLEKVRAKSQTKPISATAAKSVAGSFQITASVLKEMHDTIKDFQKIHTVEFVSLYDKKQAIELKVVTILTKYTEQRQLVVSIESEKEKAKVALQKEQLHADYRSEQQIERCKVVEMPEKRHNTLCGAAGCYSNCHIPCHLDKTFDKEPLRKCRAMNGTENCKECGHCYNLHYHQNAKFEYETYTKEFIDENMRSEFIKATDMKQRAECLMENLEQSLRQVELVQQSLTEELYRVISEFQKYSMNHNYALLLHCQIEVIEFAIKSERGNRSGLLKTKERLVQQLEIVKRAMPRTYGKAHTKPTTYGYYS
ncbi:uncharacterized protein [Dysidea avara]|uniref:uncharacterized protein n=1 Tax=Dysidea avara TaxID=196820 RepID=UPI00332CD5B3